MSELAARFRVQLEGGDQFLRWTDRAIEGVKQLEKQHGLAMQAISRGVKQTGDDMARLGVSAAKTALSVSGLSFGIAAQARGILEFRDSVTKLGTAAGTAEEDIGGLRNQILDVAAASGQMKEKVTDAIGAFVAKTGDIKTAQKNLELYAKTATGTGAAINEVALIGAELSKKFKIDDQRTAMAVLAKQGDIGAIEFKDLASQGPRIFAAAAGAGLKGEEGVRKIGGLAQLFAEGVGGSGSAARVATSIEGLMRDVSRKKGQGLLKKMGIEVGDRDAVEITEDVIRKFNGDDRAIQKTGLYTAAAMRGVMTMSRAFRDSGGKGFGKLDEFTNVAADDATLQVKFDRNSRSGQAALNRAQGAIDRSYDRNLGDSVEKLAQASGKFADVIGWMTAHPGAVAGAGVGALLAKNVIGSAIGGGGGGGLGGILGVGGSRVFVTNWPTGGGGLGGLGAAASGATEKLGTLKLMAQNATAILGVFGASLAAGAALGNYLDDKYGKKFDEVTGIDGREELDAMDKETARLKVIRDQRRGTRTQRGQSLMDSGLLVGDMLANATGAKTEEFKQTLIFNLPGGDQVTVDNDGTRKPEVKMRRGGK